MKLFVSTPFKTGVFERLWVKDRGTSNLWMFSSKYLSPLKVINLPIDRPDYLVSLLNKPHLARTKTPSLQSENRRPHTNFPTLQLNRRSEDTKVLQRGVGEGGRGRFGALTSRNADGSMFRPGTGLCLGERGPV